MFDVEVSASFAKQFRAAPKEDQRRMRAALEKLRADPRTARAGADIRALVGTDPPKWRLRVGAWRVVYAIEGRRVRVVEAFRRGRGYRE